MKVSEHEHPLTLIDVQQKYEYEEEEDEDEDDEEEEGVDHPIPKEGFHGVKCKRCGDEIHMYHRYYYKCTSICDFSLHKFCAELSNRLDHPSHQHALTFFQKWDYNDRACKVCEQKVTRHEMCYDCKECFFPIHVKCAVEPGKKMIHHPCHPHSLSCVTRKPIIYECSACGKEHKGVFFQCTTCVGFTIHNECAFLPKTLLIQETTHDAFHHTHPLTLSYSFPQTDQEAKHDPKCRVCGNDFWETWYLWIYKCDECMYYAHLDCATSRSEPFMSIFLSAGFGKTVKNYKDADHPHLLHLPFSDETYSIPKHLLFQETGTSDLEVSLTHMSHQHPLILVDLRQCNDQTSSSSSNDINSSLSLMCHDPMKKTQLLCNACLRPITSTMPFYKCAETCNFTLHEWCTRLPSKIENHLDHPQHTLLLMFPNALPHFFGVFRCAVCDLPCNGFAYCCVKCGYFVDVTCGLLPKHITHEAHPNHLLSLVPRQSVGGSCRMCLQYQFDEFSFSCKSCDIWVHHECALLLPKAIRHKYDKKHPMHLSYFPIENHKSEYFCEICEEDLNPHRSFYHCHDCVQSIHTACAPLILQCETYTYGYYNPNIYYFVNIKFGGIHNTDRHPHPLTFAQGIESDGRCSRCGYRLRYEMIFKCLECKYKVDYDCCKHLDKR